MFEKRIQDNVFRQVLYEIFQYHQVELHHRKRLLLTKINSNSFIRKINNTNLKCC
jgi:hypothetical protein